MRKLASLYIETSVFGFYYDMQKENILKRQASIKLFDQISDGIFDAYYSNITLAEIEKTKSADKRQKLLSLISRYGLEKLPDPENIEEVGLLATSLLNRNIIPINKKDDAFHLSLVILSPQMDYLVTWNYKVWEIKEEIAKETESMEFRDYWAYINRFAFKAEKELLQLKRSKYEEVQPQKTNVR
ncbi:MAG: hypothetical protein HY769_01545 [Candidatus Stahlbacteria bacterium]|nr:hypothetical protein [Candidatus Stahlbacteria bacterium]